MKAMVILLQVVLSLVLVASLTPVVLVMVPGLREGGAGQAVVVVMLVVVFVLLRLVWPRRAK